jgi:hypothetical protein
MNTEPAIVPQPKPVIAPENAIQFEVMGKEGDTKHTWDKTKPAEVEIARKMFNDFRDKKYVAYKMNPKDDSKGEQVKEFDPEAGAYLFAPALAGG